jgi:hypothetical protein
MKQKTLAEAWHFIYDKYTQAGDSEIVTEFDYLVKHDQTNLTLGDFIPCKDGKPLINNYKGAFEEIADEEFSKEYQQALDRKIYKGFEVIGYDNYEGVECPQVSNGLITITFYPHGIFKSDDTEIKVRGDLAGIADLTDETAKKLYQ